MHHDNNSDDDSGGNTNNANIADQASGYSTVYSIV